MEENKSSTNEMMNLSIRDLVWIAVLALAVVTNYFTLKENVAMVDIKVEARLNEYELKRINDKELIRIKVEALNLRLERIEKQIEMLNDQLRDK